MYLFQFAYIISQAFSVLTSLHSSDRDVFQQELRFCTAKVYKDIIRELRTDIRIIIRRRFVRIEVAEACLTTIIQLTA